MRAIGAGMLCREVRKVWSSWVRVPYRFRVDTDRDRMLNKAVPFNNARGNVLAIEDIIRQHEDFPDNQPNSSASCLRSRRYLIRASVFWCMRQVGEGQLRVVGEDTSTSTLANVCKVFRAAQERADKSD